MTSFLTRVFPPPRYLWPAATGLDISDRSVKFVRFHKTGRGLVVEKIGSVDLPSGLIEGGEIKNATKLGERLKILAQKHNLSLVVCNIPEEHAYVVRLKLPRTDLENLPTVIETELPEYIPLPPADIVFDFTPVEGPIAGIDGSKWQLVDITAAARPLLESYVTVLLAAGLQPISFEFEAAALARSLSSKKNETNLIVEIGKVRASLSIVSNNVVLNTSTVAALSGDAFTALISKNLNISIDEAEKRKIAHGLSRAQNNQEQFFALVPLVSALSDEIKKRRHFWHEHGEQMGVGPITKVILTGGQATLMGLAEYLEVSTGLSVEVVNPWQGALDVSQGLPPVPFNESLRYATAIGLALNPFDHNR